MIQLNQCLFGDCRETMRQLIDSGVKIQTCVTSPPYWGLRDYGVEGQLGLERTVDEYVKNMADVFGLVWDLLKDDGTLWLNLGDSYWRNPAKRDQEKNGNAELHQGRAASKGMLYKYSDLPEKNLMGVPWRVAFALQENGWILRSDIIWAKKNGMPESVKDRPTRSHEYIFLFSKNQKYYYDADAIKEPVKQETIERYKTGWCGDEKRDWPGQNQNNISKYMDPDNQKSEMANKRDVWHIPTKSYPEAHFAVYPAELIEPCILAGSRVGDIVFDPFFGSGTTGEVAQALGRKWIGCELNQDYEELQRKRTAQQSMAL